jgi:hypothetical protein
MNVHQFSNRPHSKYEIKEVEDENPDQANANLDISQEDMDYL